MASDVIGSARGKEESSAFQVALIAETPEGNFAQECIFIPLDDRLRHVCRKPSGSDGVHLDVVDSPLASEVFRKRDHPAFARVVANRLKFRRRAAKASDRSDVDDLAAALGNHALSNRLGKEK